MLKPISEFSCDEVVPTQPPDSGKFMDIEATEGIIAGEVEVICSSPASETRLYFGGAIFIFLSFFAKELVIWFDSYVFRSKALLFRSRILLFRSNI